VSTNPPSAGRTLFTPEPAACGPSGDDTDLSKTRAFVQTPSWDEVEDAQVEGTLSSRARIDAFPVVGAPRPRHCCSGAHFDLGRCVFPPLDVGNTNQATAYLNDLSTSVLHPRLVERLPYVLVPGAKTS